MQDIEQNMDDLFRKAAADYPLKVNESQWDDIAPGLDHKPINPVAAKKSISKKYAGWFLLLLSLLLTDGIITTTLKNNKPVMHPTQPVAENKRNAAIITNETADYSSNNKAEKKQADQKYYSGHSALQSKADYPSLYFKKEIIQKQTTISETKTSKIEHTSMIALSNPGLLEKTKTNSSNTITSAITQEILSEGNKTGSDNDIYSQTKNQATMEDAIVKIATHQPRGVYLGAAAGPLFDEVKNQGLKKTGFSAGIIAGYQFKNHLSVETGLLFAKKPYFSTGKYFSMAKISKSMPAGMQMLSLDGNNYIWEIPARLKYDFLYRNKSNFFLTAGITSYIMTYEKNNYLISMNGSQQTMIDFYKNKSRSLAATFDISAGYEHKIGKSSHIRIEPYIQIPLKGMGVGSMPMISSGLRIGITKFTN